MSSAPAQTVPVPATANIFDSGLSSVPLPPGCGDPSDDCGGGTLPPAIPITYTQNQYLLFSATGQVAPCCNAYSDASGSEDPTDINSYGGISGIKADRALFLVGVFLSDSGPSTSPPRLDFTSSGLGDDYTELHPELGQTFMIGTGQSPNGPCQHKIYVPQGATRLFLGFADAQGFQGDPSWYNDNQGVLTATVQAGTGVDGALSLHRLRTVDDCQNPTGSGDNPIDDPIVPEPDPAVLKCLPSVAKGLVADEVTPLVIEVSSPGDSSVTVNFDTWLGGSFAGGEVYPDGTFVSGPTVRVLDGNEWVQATLVGSSQPRLKVPLQNGVGFAYIPAVQPSSLSLNSGSTELLANLNVTSPNSGTYPPKVIHFEKPPVVLVHGIASNSYTWYRSDETTSPFADALNTVGQQVIPIDYGPIDVPSNDPAEKLRACVDPLTTLAQALDQVLSGVETQLVSDWAMTRYDVIGHSQGGVLLRMLCLDPEQSQATYFNNQAGFRSDANFNRGRFRRIVTIAAPQNGAIAATYLLALDQQLNQQGGTPLSSPSGYLIFDSLTSKKLIRAKFDPFGWQMRGINSLSKYQVDTTAPFHRIATLVNGGQKPNIPHTINWYQDLGLQSPAGDFMYPEGSDSIVEPGSALGDNLDYSPDNEVAEIWRNPSDPNPSDADAQHLATSVYFLGYDVTRPFNFYNLDDTHAQTQNAALADHIASLLKGPKIDANFVIFGPFKQSDMDVVRPMWQQAVVQGAAVKPRVIPIDPLPIVPSIAALSKVRSSIANSGRLGLAASAQSSTSTFTYTLRTSIGDIVSGSVRWAAQVFGPDGSAPTSVSLATDPNDVRNVTVSVADGVIGDVVLEAQYVSSADGVIVLGTPVVVTSQSPSSVESGIAVDAFVGSPGPGEILKITIHRLYQDGTSATAFVPANANVSVTSSDPSIVTVTGSLELTAVSAGVATITVAFEGFDTQTTVTVAAIPPVAVNDTVTDAGKDPVTISVLDNDESFTGSTLTISSVTQPAYGSVQISGADVIYTPGPLGSGLTTDKFKYTVQDSSGAVNSATVTIQRPVPPNNNPPVLTLPNSPIVAEATSPSGASVQFSLTATDPEDGDLTPQLSSNSGDTFPIGTTTVTCSATDFYGVTTSGSFNVVVQDTTPPTMSLNGRNPLIVGLGINYVELGATATDLVSGSTSISISGQVNTNQVGSYTITYTSTDAAGNTATATRVVNVVVPYAGLIDGGFGSGGAAVNFIGSDAGANAVAMQPDGKIVAAGYASVVGQNNFALVRYNTDGSVDTTFNGTGVVTTAIGSNDTAYSVAVQSDGKIVAAGSSQSNGVPSFALARYNTDGRLDTTFNGSGKVTTSFGSNTNSGATSIAIQTDSKIVVAGSRLVTTGAFDIRFAVARYNTDGSLDTGFNKTGEVITDFSGFAFGTFAEASGVTLQRDGKIVVVGTSVQGVNAVFSVARYDTTGALDPSFNGTGKVLTAVGNTNDYGMSIAVQPDSKIVVGGYSEINGKDDFAVVRYNGDGSLDTSFNGTGKVTTAIGNSDDEGRSLAIDTTGRIILGGYSYSSSAGADFAVARYNPNGSLDTSFNTSGFVTTDLQGGDDFGYGVALQPDGKLVLVGRSLNGGQGTFGIVRYIGSAPIQPTNVVSRKYHGSGNSAPYFDVPLSLTGKTGIECRTNRTAGAHNVIATFQNALGSVSSVAATARTSTGTVTLNPAPTGSIILDQNNNPTNQYSIDLTAVPNASHVLITLHGVIDADGSTGDVTIPMDVLLGDVNGSGRTDNGDAIAVRNRSGTTPTDTNSARADVNCSGRIDNGDAIVVRNNSGTALP